MPKPTYLAQPLTLDPICQAALRCFAVSGFHGTSIRQIAAEAGLSVPGIYHHYESKSAVLVAICDVALDTLLSASHQAVLGGTSTLESFDRLVGCLIQFHAEYGEIAFVSHSEIRSLPDIARERHQQQRREIQGLIASIVEQGVEEGMFAPSNAREAARAIGTICLGVSQWYRADGEMSLGELIDVYLEICKDTVRIAR